VVSAVASTSFAPLAHALYGLSVAVLDEEVTLDQVQGYEALVSWHGRCLCTRERADLIATVCHRYARISALLKDTTGVVVHVDWLNACAEAGQRVPLEPCFMKVRPPLRNSCPEPLARCVLHLH
jgi:hypothetical protein